MEPRKEHGVIGVTDDGYPIVTDGHACKHWMPGGHSAYEMPECWYCRYADFRKTTRIVLQKSVCRNPRCRVVPAEGILPGAQNEALEHQA